VVIRHLTKSDISAYGQLVLHAFNGSRDGLDRYEKFVCRYLNSTFGAFDGKRLLAGMWVYPFQMRVGDRDMSMGGVAAVATWPDARNLGLVARMMQKAHETMRREGRAIAVLMPFRNSFYERLGYADVFYHHRWDFRPEDLARPGRHRARARMVDGLTAWQDMETLHQTVGANRLGTVRRDALFWRVRLLPEDKVVRNTYVIERGKELVGFIVARQSNDPGDKERTLFVEQAVWLDNDALQAILALIWSHRDQMKKVTWHLPTDVDLFPFFSEAITPEVHLKHKMMLKLVDLKAAIEQRSYPKDLEGEASLKVDADSTSLWNEGLWRIEIAGGQAEVRKIRAAGGRRGVPCRIQTLSAIYSGFRSASELVRLGQASFPAETCRVLDRAFPRGVPYMQEWF